MEKVLYSFVCDYVILSLLVSDFFAICSVIQKQIFINAHFMIN